jgi:hypothetical protein
MISFLGLWPGDRNSFSDKGCRRAGPNLAPRWSMDSTRAGFIFGVPGTEHITGATSLTSVIAKLVANESPES